MSPRIYKLPWYKRSLPGVALLALAVGLVVPGSVVMFAPGAIIATFAAATFALGNRVRIEISTDGICYRGWRAGLDWHRDWFQLWGISLDRVRSTNGESPRLRIRIEQKDARPFEIRGFSRTTGSRLAEHFAHHGLTVHDETDRLK